MINIKTFTDHYQFQDGEKIITTKDPTMDDLMALGTITKLEKPEEALEILDDILKKALYEEDQHYVNELPSRAKIALIIDYLQYHTAQLESSFPSTGSQFLSGV